MALNLVASTAVAALLTVPSSAFAQTYGQAADPMRAPTRYADAAPVSYYDVRRMAYDEGYKEGVKEGEKDARQGDRHDYVDEREYQRADRGYHRSYGERERYRQLFRDGYASGYNAGYARLARGGYNGSYGQQGPYRQGPYGPQGPYTQRGGYGAGVGGYGRYPGGTYNSPAFDNGARDGYEKGQEDTRKNRNFDPLRHSWYRSGDRHYENDYGSRDQYKNIYREGFQRGYERGYQEARYRY